MLRAIRNMFGGGDADKDKSEAQRLYGLSVELGSRFMSYAASNNIISKHVGVVAASTWPPDHAVRLGYELVSVAYRLRPDARQGVVKAFRSGFANVLLSQAADSRARLFSAMGVGPMVGAGMQPEASEAKGMRDLAAVLLKQAEGAIGGTLEAISRDDARPLRALYANLIPAFGGPADPDQVEARYATILGELFAVAREAA